MSFPNQAADVMPYTELEWNSMCDRSQAMSRLLLCMAKKYQCYCQRCSKSFEDLPARALSSVELDHTKPNKTDEPCRLFTRKEHTVDPELFEEIQTLAPVCGPCNAILERERKAEAARLLRLP